MLLYNILIGWFMRYFFILLMLPSIFAHKDCCNHNQRKWGANLSLSATNTSDNYYPTNHHQGLGLDHSHFSANGPAGDYLDASASLAFNTSKKSSSKKILFKKKAEELSLKTNKNTHSYLGAKVGRFASHISPNNQKICCSNSFIKRPLLYRGFLGGHLIDNGAHVDYTIDHYESAKTTLGFEALQGKGLMSKSNKVGLLSLIARHKIQFNQQHGLDFSASYLANNIYNQRVSKTHNHVGCCQASSYTGKNMLMANSELTSKINEDINHSFTVEWARINKLANRYGKNKHHIAYSIGSVTAFQKTNAGTIEAGLRFDHLRGMKFCSYDGAYFSKTIEKTIMLGWKPSENHTLRFEHTTQKLKKQKNNHIFQVNYNLHVCVF